MLRMPSGFWEQVVADGLKVPQDRSLVEMTEDLTRMLGDPDPEVRDGIAFPTMATWIDEGVYDDLLVGLGDGMCHGLDIGLGEVESDTVFRRSFSALILTECIDRTTRAALGGPNVVLRCPRRRRPRRARPLPRAGPPRAHRDPRRDRRPAADADRGLLRVRRG
jgi:hypothetical protein